MLQCICVSSSFSCNVTTRSRVQWNWTCFRNADQQLVWLWQSFLQREFGQKTGNMLWSYARGSDVRQVQPAQVSSMLTCLMHLHGSVKFIGLNIKGACAYLGAYTLACAHTLAAYTLTFLYGTLQERKSIGAEVNWGVRFLCPEDVRLISFSYCSR